MHITKLQVFAPRGIMFPLLLDVFGYISCCPIDISAK